jgi:PTS system mannose-specific IIC component
MAISNKKKLNILAITGCAAGIAHTFMAAEGIEKGAKKMGHKIKVETHGTMGPENVFTAKEIRDADLIIIAAEIAVNLDRFFEKEVYVTDTKLAITNSTKLIEDAMAKSNKHKMSKMAARKTSGEKSEVNDLTPGIVSESSKVLKHIMYALG